MNRIIIELLLQCIEWLRNTFLHLLQKMISAGKMCYMRKYFPAWPRSRWVVGEISVRRGNIQLIWTEPFCWWKLALWQDLVGIISPSRWNNFSHRNSPLEQNWKNVIHKGSFAEVLRNRCSINFPNFTGEHLC